jgi:hypothetical protein
VLALLALVPLAAAHAPDACEEVRAVRRYAVAGGLDTTTLDTLEARLCAGDTAPAPLSALAADRCHDLDLMTLLAGTGGLGERDRQLVEPARELTCTGAVPDLPTWANGTTARFDNGTWQYPSGTTARFANGVWQYPSGTTARFGNGVWQYPNGTTARLPNGRWQAPDGQLVGDRGALLAWACGRRPDACRGTGDRLGALDPHRAEATLVAYAWSAR